MTKSEAKAIEQRMGKAVRILNGTCEPKALDWTALRKAGGEALVQLVNESILEARNEVEAVLEMACAELGPKR